MGEGANSSVDGRNSQLLSKISIYHQNGSKNCQKAQIKVARMHHRIANRRKDFHLKTAHKLCSGAQTIFAPDLNVKGLTRGMPSKDCVDAEEGQFLSLTEWVCWKRGCTLLKSIPTLLAKPAQLALQPSVRSSLVREHRCPECNYRTHRDRAAAEMVLHRGLENLLAQGLWGTETACQVSLSGVYNLDK